MRMMRNLKKVKKIECQRINSRRRKKEEEEIVFNNNKKKIIPILKMKKINYWNLKSKKKVHIKPICNKSKFNRKSMRKKLSMPSLS